MCMLHVHHAHVHVWVYRMRTTSQTSASCTTAETTVLGSMHSRRLVHRLSGALSAPRALARTSPDRLVERLHVREHVRLVRVLVGGHLDERGVGQPLHHARHLLHPVQRVGRGGQHRARHRHRVARRRERVPQVRLHAQHEPLQVLRRERALVPRALRGLLRLPPHRPHPQRLQPRVHPPRQREPQQRPRPERKLEGGVGREHD
mmetsp:Transcript_2571/g.7825  ORF Transcript_2571/g.7825 Transcript_2571/m.7825 type:complete len:204 (-) Transcript_2571:698-1309(-)